MAEDRPERKAGQEHATADKQPTQAVPRDGSTRASASGPQPGSGRGGMGESGGGPYPNPHTGAEGSASGEGASEHGGQSVMGYHGKGQLGGKAVEDGKDPNAAARSD